MSEAFEKAICGRNQVIDVHRGDFVHLDYASTTRDGIVESAILYLLFFILFLLRFPQVLNGHTDMGGLIIAPEQILDGFGP